jgi:K+-transporting ATPase KdpF subunit
MPASARQGRRRGDEREVSTEDLIGLVLAVAVLAYLVYALLAPEKLG